MNIKKIIYIIVGFIGLGLGFFGAVVPLVPAFPFLLVAAICFSKSSERLDNWFKSTKLYKNNLESYINGQGMPKKSKIRVVCLISGLMAFGFVMMSGVVVGRIILFFVWLFHVWYFFYKVEDYQEK
ncbi:YbaN family protein [Tannockella kyphosi]|uniref:YbaN family protein n=1 Tax=Tannockella kyphosi TaxID=2899121 RepID=UPI002013027B|nr:YbaN family protein [Tannockella kyphosi]